MLAIAPLLLLAAAQAFEAPGSMLTNCDAVVPSLGAIRYSLTGQQRNSVRNATSTMDFNVSGSVMGYDQNGLLGSLALTTFSEQQNDTYHFVCTFSEDQLHVATCTLTFEEPARVQGPAWVTAKFHDVKMVSVGDRPPTCIAASITIIGSYPFSSVTDDAGIYAMRAVLEPPPGMPPAHMWSVARGEDAANILIVYAPDSNGLTKQLASALSDGAASASANVKLLMVQQANYERDVFQWADALVLGSGVYNGNAAPEILEFINSFDFENRLTSKVGSVFATAGSAAAGLQGTLEEMSRGMSMFGMVIVGGNSWQNARGTGIVTNGSQSVAEEELALAKDQGARVAGLAKVLSANKPTPSPVPSIGVPPSWGQTWRATVSANVTQVGYDAGLVIVNFTGDCSTPSTQKMLTVYGDFDTVLTRCDLGYEFIIDPPSRGGKCHPRVIGKDVDRRICEACSCPFCVRDTNGSFTHGEQFPSKTQWENVEDIEIQGVGVRVWRGRAISAREDYALQTSIAYSSVDHSTPLFVNVSHPLWLQSAARIDNFTRRINNSDFAIPPSCINSQGLEVHLI
jgi:NAD(P)H dehydrogenase (quinone)